MFKIKNPQWNSRLFNIVYPDMILETLVNQNQELFHNYYLKGPFSAKKIFDLLKDKNAELIHKANTWIYGNTFCMTYHIPESSIYLCMMSETTIKDSMFDFLKRKHKNNDEIGDQFVIFYTDSDEELVNELHKKIIKYKLDTDSKTIDRHYIGILTVNFQGGLEITQVDITDKIVSIDDMDLHYGKDFNKFYQNVINYLKTKNQGLFLFHGMYGTGKTVFIRNLIKSVPEKTFLYVPKQIAENVQSPELMTFLLSYIEDADVKKLILIIEDADEALKDRKGNMSSGAVSNILNLTDGILNDLLSVQIIATCNMDTDDIDPALLRHGRLLARKEFSRLNNKDAATLVNKLGLNIKVPKEGLTLAEIYSEKDKKETLLHNINEIKEQSFGFTI